jgi:hypothetical protein
LIPLAGRTAAHVDRRVVQGNLDIGEHAAPIGGFRVIGQSLRQVHAQGLVERRERELQRLPERDAPAFRMVAVQFDARFLQHAAHAAFDFVALVRVEIGKIVASHEHPGHVRPHRDGIDAQPVEVVFGAGRTVADMGQGCDREWPVRFHAEQGEAQMVGGRRRALERRSAAQDAFQRRQARDRRKSSRHASQVFNEERDLQRSLPAGQT